MADEIPPPLALTLLILLRRRGWNQKKLAAALHLKEETVSDWIRAGKGLDRKRLEESCRHLGFEAGEIDRTLDYLAGKRPGEDEEIPGYGDLTPAERRFVRETRARVVQGALDALDADLPRLIEQQRHHRARAAAETHWQTLRSLPAEERKGWIDETPACHTPAFVARVCDESIKAAGRSATRALALAKLALYVAERVPGEVSRKCQGYAKGFIANAFRVGGQLRKAGGVFTEARKLWEESAAGNPALDEARFLDLEASLLTAQRRFDESLARLDQALSLSQGRREAKILIKKSHVQHVRGQYGEALETLRQAASRLVPGADLQSWFAVEFNRAANLSRLDKHEEAQGLLPGIWELVETLDEGDLHLLRLRWLAAGISAGLGDTETAIRSLEEVRKELADQENPFDAALASLDLAEIYLKKGRRPQVGALAGEMIRLFQGQGVHREALAALLLFRQSVEREEATVDLIRRLARYLREAREDPSHHFEG